MNLTDQEARIIGCLMEKSITTPDVYPLTLNALTNACNQKTSRNPVMSLEPGRVKRTARELQGKHLVRAEENYKSGVEKFTQTFCNTTFGDLQFSPPQFAIICMMLLRGAQTPGELKARSGRLHTFNDPNEVVKALEELINWEKKPLVVKLPRMPGRKDSQYMHLFSGPIDIEALSAQAAAAKEVAEGRRSNLQELTDRITQLEADVAELKAMITKN